MAKMPDRLVLRKTLVNDGYYRGKVITKIAFYWDWDLCCVQFSGEQGWTVINADYNHDEKYEPVGPFDTLVKAVRCATVLQRMGV